MSVEFVRCFVAIELPEDVKAALGSVQAALERPGKKAVRWVAPTSMHLTLKFLGEVPAVNVPQIEVALGEAVKGQEPLEIETDGLGFFPTATRPRVFWIGVNGQIDRLLKLQDNVEVALNALGYPREKRGFSAHLTLARMKLEASAMERQAFAEKAAKVHAPGGVKVEVKGVSLMRSVLRREGAIYSRLCFFPLSPG